MHSALLQGGKLNLVLDRLCYQLLEDHGDFSGVAVLGLQPRGPFLARLLFNRLQELSPASFLRLGTLDPTFHRDDVLRKGGPIIPMGHDVQFSVEEMKIVLVDDVLYTGRTIRAGMDALVDFGRPKSVELLVLVDRKYSRELPIEPKYVGIAVDTRVADKVKVRWSDQGEALEVYMLTPDEPQKPNPQK